MATAAVASPLAPPLSHPFSVLIVEDNAALADSMSFALNALGWDVAGSVASVEEALAALEGEPPTTAVVDVHLGDLFSWPVAARLRELGIPFVFLSGLQESDEAPSEFRSEVWLPKPIEPDELIERLEELVRGARS